MKNEEEFYVWVDSTAASPSGLKNTPQKFSISTQYLDQLQGKWQVALAEIQYPLNWFNVPEDINLQIRYFTSKSSASHWSVTIPAGLYEDNLALIKKLNEICHLQPWKDKPAESLIFSVDPLTQRVSMRNATGKFVQLLPFRISSSIDQEKMNEDRAIQLFQMLGYEPEWSTHYGDEIMITSSMTPTNQASLTLHSPGLYIYCNFVDYQLVGNERAQLLRVVPITGKFGTISHKEFINPQYLDLSSGYINSLSFEILDDTGKPFQFRGGKVTLALHFRPKRI